jgi:hypothetical protein
VVHYFTAVVCPGTDWTVVVTPSSANDDPDLYVNYFKLNFPNSNMNDGRSVSVAGDEEQVVVGGVTAARTELRIAVRGFGERSEGAGVSFTIKVVPVSGVNTCDRDNDGVPEEKDLCPGSTRASREHVDVNGCEHDQVDFDMDGWCNPGMPRIGKQPFTTRADFCVGVDNCKFVKSAGQEQNYPADNSNDGDGSGDACNTGECQDRPCVGHAVRVHYCNQRVRVCVAAGCHEACLIGCDSIASQSPRDSITGKSCTSPFRGGRYHNDLRCMEGSDFGCEKL